MTDDDQAGDVAGEQGPDYDEVLQLEPDALVEVPVCIREPLTVRQAPAVGGQAVTRTATTTEGVKLVSANPLRQRVLIVGDDSFYLGFTKGEVEAKLGQIPAGTTIELHNVAELWTMAAVAQTYVTVISEFWAH